MTSVDNSAAIGLDLNLHPALANLHKKVDGLISNVDKLIEDTNNFKDAYEKQLNDKDNFYQNDQEFEEKA